MIVWCLCLGATTLLLGVLLFFSVRKNLMFAEQLIGVGSQVEESLDVLNDCYQRFSKVAKMPVMSDEPTVRQLLNDVKHARDAILLVANKIVDFDSTGDENVQTS